MNAKSAIRRQMRALRRELSPAQQRLAAIQLALRLQKLPAFRAARHIAAYIPNDGEIDPGPIVRSAQRQGTHIYLPVLQGDSMVFIRYRPGLTRLRANALGIPEPPLRPNHIIEPGQLDLVLMPLVAFDGRCQRLGMGGGFYDRTFAWKLRPNAAARPVLIGLAHHRQFHSAIPAEAWDVPLSSVATDRALWLRHGENRPG